MRHETLQHDPEPERRKRVALYADEAEALAKTLDLVRYPFIHITKALRSVPDGRERDKLFGEVRNELLRRDRIRKKEEASNKDAEETIKELRGQQIAREAYAHQMRQPRDTWDPTVD